MERRNQAPMERTKRVRQGVTTQRKRPSLRRDHFGHCPLYLLSFQMNLRRLETNPEEGSSNRRTPSQRKKPKVQECRTQRRANSNLPRHRKQITTGLKKPHPQSGLDFRRRVAKLKSNLTRKFPEPVPWRGDMREREGGGGSQSVGGL